MRHSEILKEASLSSLVREGDKRKSVLAKIQTFKILDNQEQSLPPCKLLLNEFGSPVKS